MLSLASGIDKNVDARTQDLLLSCGEIISTTLLAHELTRDYQVHLSVRPLLGSLTSGTEFVADQ